MHTDPTFGGYMTLSGERKVRLVSENSLFSVVNDTGESGNREFHLSRSGGARMKTVSNTFLEASAKA